MMINVLVAEDEPLILNSITKLIHSLDSDFIVCARAKNGLEVLQCLNSQPINIIFTDIKMPLLNGLDLIQEIRNRSLNVPIVILSGYNDFSYAKKALKLGVFDYLLKPIDPEELSNTLGKLKQLYANTVKEQQQHFFHQFAVGRTPSMPQMSLPQIKKMAVIILSSGCYPAYPFLFRCPHYPSGKPYSWTKCWSRHFLLICFSKVNPVFWKMNISFSFFPLLIPTISMNWIITSPDSSGRLIFLNIRFTYAMESAKTAMTASMRRFCH